MTLNQYLPLGNQSGKTMFRQADAHGVAARRSCGRGGFIPAGRQMFGMPYKYVFLVWVLWVDTSNPGVRSEIWIFDFWVQAQTQTIIIQKYWNTKKSVQIDPTGSVRALVHDRMVPSAGLGPAVGVGCDARGSRLLGAVVVPRSVHPQPPADRQILHGTYLVRIVAFRLVLFYWLHGVVAWGFKVADSLVRALYVHEFSKLVQTLFFQVSSCWHATPHLRHLPYVRPNEVASRRAPGSNGASLRLHAGCRSCGLLLRATADRNSAVSWVSALF